jgi:hypothetical protein
MTTNDEIKKGNELLNDQVELAGVLDNAFKSMAANIQAAFGEVADSLEGVDTVGQKIAKSYERDIVSSIKKMNGGLEQNIALQLKINKGTNVQKELDQKIDSLRVKAKLTLEKINQENGLSNEQKKELRKQLLGQFIDEKKNLELLQKRNKEGQKSKSLTDLLSGSLTKYANKLDESGTLSELLKGNFDEVLTTTRLTEIGMAMLVKAMFSASDAINNIQKQTGLSYQESRKFTGELAIAATNSGKLFINSKELGKAFGELTKQTGLIADFGGDTLVTQATLTKQLGLSATEAGTLSTLARIQSEDTESVLENTVGTVNALVKQSGVAVNVKGIIEEIANASAAIQVSLGKSPQALAEAATAAKIFGSNLAEVDAISDSLLQFQSSIEAELKAELLTGKQLNLEKARLLALNNDIKGLSEELANDGAIIEAFSTGNRIQQEAAAEALGMSRDQLAKIALQQDLNNLSAEQFRDTYGETTYNSLQAQSASEKFADTLAKIQGIIGDIGIAFAPILDGFASLVGFIASSKVVAAGLVGVMTTLAALSVASSIANIMSSFGMVPFGIGVPLGVAAVAGMLATIGTGIALATADDMAYGDNMLVTKNKGAIMLNNQDSVLAGTNLFGGGGGAEFDYDKMASAVSKTQVNVSTKYDSFSANSTSANGGRYQSTARYESKFV